MKRYIAALATVVIAVSSAYSHISNFNKAKISSPNLISIEIPNSQTSVHDFEPQIQTDGDLTFKTVSVIGNKRNQTVKVIITVSNRAANRKGFYTSVESFTSNDGEQLKIAGSTMSIRSGLKTLYTGVPVKAEYVFKGVLPKITTIKLLPIPHTTYRDGKNEHGSVEFKDLPITWR